jgi:hypothetical protein
MELPIPLGTSWNLHAVSDREGVRVTPSKRTAVRTSVKEEDTHA